MKVDDDFSFWNKKPDVTSEIFKHASEFLAENSDTLPNLASYDDTALEVIDDLIEAISSMDKSSPEVWRYESGLLSYAYAAFCTRLGGRCFGTFNKNNAGAAFYALRMCIDDNVYNLSIPFLSAVERGATFSELVSDYL